MAARQLRLLLGGGGPAALQPITRRIVLANRLQAGSIDGIGQGLAVDTNKVPFSRRYFLGGSTSLRGWGRLEVSPLSAVGPPDRRLEHARGERGAARRDHAAISASWASSTRATRGSAPGSSSLGDLRVAVGPGLRYRTPIGPVRADFGYQLTPIEGLLVNGEPETRRWRVHFSIGQAF